MIMKCRWMLGPTGIGVRGDKKVYMEKIGDINARRVRDAILEGVNIRQAKQGPSFFFTLSPNTLK